MRSPLKKSGKKISSVSTTPDNQTFCAAHLANTFGNSSHLVVYPGESL